MNWRAWFGLAPKKPTELTAKITYKVEPWFGIHPWIGTAVVRFSDGTRVDANSGFGYSPDEAKTAVTRNAERIVDSYKKNNGQQFNWTDTK